ncbi:hypothetical protein EIP91_003934 [Steccherinum ochraceum]|uniref:F-box domain-containing protein n=1 Tax=Steccherinum ochraceum TaxID=92696 RepID=A0A4R0RUM6_9APHY|nr:hypothetical protein EIP91_003934 [Steccherinum ochraceum]
MNQNSEIALGSGAAKVPNELWDAILSCFGGDNKSLSSYSLLSRSCREQAIPHLFTTLSILSHSAEDFMSFVDSSPAIASCINQLTIRDPPKSSAPKVGPGEERRELHILQLAQIVRGLPSLQRLFVQCNLRATGQEHHLLQHTVPSIGDRMRKARILRKINVLDINVDAIEDGPCQFSSLILVLSLFSSIDTLRLSRLPAYMSCDCVSRSSVTPIDYDNTDDMLLLPDHTRPKLTVTSLEIHSHNFLSPRMARAVSKLFIHDAQSHPIPRLESLTLWCGRHVQALEPYNNLIRAHGSHLKHCSLSFGTRICTWPRGISPDLPIDLSSCTSLESLVLTGNWNTTLGMPNGPIPSTTFVNALATLPAASNIKQLTIELTMRWYIFSFDEHTISGRLYPAIDWHSLRNVLGQKLSSSLRSFTFDWTVNPLNMAGDILQVRDWMQKTVQVEFAQMDKAKTLIVRVAATNS